MVGVLSNAEAGRYAPRPLRAQPRLSLQLLDTACQIKSKLLHMCVILDIHLGGASGIDLRHQLLQSGSTVPVVFITGSDSETTRQAALQAGCTAYLPKPFSAQALVDGIYRALSSDAGEVSPAPNNTCEPH